MSSVVIQGDRASGSVAASTTIYAPIALGSLHQASTPATATNIELPWRTPGVFSKAFIHVSANDRAASTWVLIDGATPLNLSISITGSATGEFKDDTHTDTVSAGASLAYRLITGSGGTSFVDRAAGVIFTATSNTATRFGGFSSPTISVDSTNVFQPITGQTANTAPAAETEAQFKLRMAGTLRNLQMYVAGNSRITTSTLESRINSAPGAQSISILAAATGVKEDTTHTDTVAANDLVCSNLAMSTGGGSLVINCSGMDLETTSQSHRVLGAILKTVNANTTQHYAPSGNMNGSTTESDYQVDARMTDTFGNLTINVITNTLSNAATLTFRKGGADGAQSISIAAGATGVKEDTTHTDGVAANDLINYKLVTITGGTSIIFNNIGITSGMGSAPPAARRRLIVIGE